MLCIASSSRTRPGRRILGDPHRKFCLGGLAPLLSALLIASSALAQDAPACPEGTFGLRLLTPPSGRIPRDAAFVVGLSGEGTFRELPPIQLNRGRRDVAMIRETIAPGLFRLRPDTRRIWGRWQIGVPGAPPILFGRPGTGSPPTRPRLERVERYRVASGGASRTEVRAHFGFPLPDGVVAVVAFWGDDDQPDGWAQAVPTARDIVVSRVEGDCPQLAPGATAPPESGSVRVAFVGRYGQLGPISEPATYGQ